MPNFPFSRVGKSFIGFVMVLVLSLVGCEQAVEDSNVSASSVQVGRSVLLHAVDSTGKSVVISSANSRVDAAATPYVSGFSFPFGSDKLYTESSDGDGWRNDQGLVYGKFVANKWHLGEDWNAETGGNTDQGSPVYAMAEGEVVYSQYVDACWGRVVILRHRRSDGSQIETMYGHLSSNSVSVGQIVQRRQPIGAIGGQGLNCSGVAMSAHLHLEARYSSCSSWGKPGPGYGTSTTGWFAASSLVYANFPTVPIALSTPANNASIRRSTSQLFSWQNFWLLNAESRIQIAYSANNSSPAWNAQSGFQSGLVYNQNIGKYNGLYFSFSVAGTYYWTVRSNNIYNQSGYGLYTSNFSQPRKFAVLSY